MKVNILTQYSTLLPGSNTAWEEDADIFEYELRDVLESEVPVQSFTSESTIIYAGGCKKKQTLEHDIRVYNDKVFEPVMLSNMGYFDTESDGPIGLDGFIRHIEQRFSLHRCGYRTKESTIRNVEEYLSEFILVNGVIFRYFCGLSSYLEAMKE